MLLFKKNLLESFIEYASKKKSILIHVHVFMNREPYVVLQL